MHANRKSLSIDDEIEFLIGNTASPKDANIPRNVLLVLPLFLFQEFSAGLPFIGTKNAPSVNLAKDGLVSNCATVQKLKSLARTTCLIELSFP